MGKIRVQMPKGVNSVSVCGSSYDVGKDGVVEVDSHEHVAPLVAHGGIEIGPHVDPGRNAALIGTDTLPTDVIITEGEEPRRLVDIVAETQTRSGVSADEWNNLPQRVRDILIGLQVAEARGDWGNVRSVQGLLDDANAEKGRLATELEGARSSVADLEAKLAAAGGQGGGAGDDGGNGGGDEAPDFEKLTKAQINDWLTANKGEPASGNHDAHVAAATKRLGELQSQEQAES